MVRWIAAALAWFALPVVAQVGTSGDSDRQFEAGRTADLQNWKWRAQRGVAQSESDKALQAVTDAVAARDCAGAAARLNEGLAKGHAAVMNLAGAMYEEGICLRPNWERAATFYQRADAAGHRGAAARLAAGYAAPVGGRDLAAALWWAVRAKTVLPAPCAQVAPLVHDADRFVAALKAWPAGQLNACVYVAAVMASVQAEAAAPGLGAALGLSGPIAVSFAPEQGRIDIRDDKLVASQAAGVVADGAVRDSQALAARSALTEHLRQVAERAMKRYDKPVSIVASWRMETEYELGATR